jgi:capsular polysaccharide biosynthesis protein
MAVKIGILSNCQHESLAVALAGLLPSAEIVSFELNTVIHDLRGRDNIAAILHGCDHVISQDISPGYGPLETRVLSQAVKRFHLIPAFHFGGFHPDTVYAMMDHVPVEGPVGVSLSRIVIAAYLAGLSADEAGNLFNGLVYARLGYFDAVAEQSALLLEKFAGYGIDLSDALARWMAAGCFMYCPVHPKLVVFLDLARAACGMMGLTPEANPRVTMLRDPMAAFPTVPFLPEIASRLGMRAEGTIRGTLPSRPLSLPEFIAGTYKALQRVPLAALRQAPGVAACMATLGLADGKRDAPPQTGTHAVLSQHGTMLRADVNSNLLLHEPVWPESADSVDFTLTPVTAGDGTVSAAVMGGVQVVPGGAPGTVSLRRRGTFVSVDPGRLAVPLNRTTVSIWERFVLLSLEEAADLRDILARNWRTGDGDKAIPAAIISVKPNFILDFGDFTVDLSAHRPVRLAGEPGFTVQGPAGPQTIRPDPDTQIAEIALRQAPKSAYPDEAGSLPAFRTASHHAFTLDGGDEVLHLPLTMCRAHAEWLYEKWYYPPTKLPLGPGRHGAKMQRVPNVTVLLNRGMEGVILNRQGVLKHHEVLRVKRPFALPPGLRRHDETVLMAHDMAYDRTPIAGPSVVGFNASLENYYHWLVETALPLWIMAPYLPPGATLLIPSTITAMAETGKAAFDHLAVLDAVGLGGLPRQQVDGPARMLSDAIWLDNVNLPVIPASMLRRFRDAVAALYPVESGPRRRIYVQRRRLREVAENPALDEFLAGHGFVSVVLEDLTPVAQIKLFLHAEMVVAVHGAGLANLLFCPAGTRVLEIAPAVEFRPFFWMIAEKMGFPYGVLPCPSKPGGFNGTLQVDLRRFRALYRMLRFFSI